MPPISSALVSRIETLFAPPLVTVTAPVKSLSMLPRITWPSLPVKMDSPATATGPLWVMPNAFTVRSPPTVKPDWRSKAVVSVIEILLRRLPTPTLGEKTTKPLKVLPMFDRTTLPPLTPVNEASPVPVVIVPTTAWVMSPPAVTDSVPASTAPIATVPNTIALASLN